MEKTYSEKLAMKYYTYVLIERRKDGKQVSYTEERMAETQAGLFEKIFRNHDVEAVVSINIINVEEG